MHKFVFSLLFLVNGISFAQLHNRLLKFNVGISSEQIDYKNQIDIFNDTSDVKFELVSKSPIVSYTHEYVLSNVVSISGKVGYQYFNIFYNNEHYGSSFFYVSINPMLSVFYRGRFEYYVKLQAGVNYWFNQPEKLSNLSRRVFPEGANVFTGVTLGGFNYYLTDNLGLNLELSIWSPEMLTFGLSYRFYKGELPSFQDMENL